MGAKSKVGACYLFDKNKKVLQEVDKYKCALLLNKQKYIKLPIPIIENMSYEDIVKKASIFKKSKPGVYSFELGASKVFMIVTVNYIKEKLEKDLGINIQKDTLDTNDFGYRVNFSNKDGEELGDNDYGEAGPGMTDFIKDMQEFIKNISKPKPSKYWGIGVEDMRSNKSDKCIFAAGSEDGKLKIFQNNLPKNIWDRIKQ